MLTIRLQIGLNQTINTFKMTLMICEGGFSFKVFSNTSAWFKQVQGALAVFMKDLLTHGPKKTLTLKDS